MPADNLRGILLMLVSMALFGIEDMFLKLATAHLPSGQIIFVSGALGLPVFLVLAWRQGQRVWSKAALHPTVLARNLGEMVATIAYIYALATIPLATVSAVLQALPLAVTMAAALFMQEQVGWRRWVAICGGFSGGILVIRPGMDGFKPEALWVLVSVAALVLRDLSSRAIPKDCSTTQISAWGLMAITLLGALMMLQGGAVVPTPSQAGVLAAAALFGTAGYAAIVAASRTGEVSVVAPFRYARLIFAIVIGVTVFSETLDLATIIGAAMIIGSGLYSFTRERMRKRALSMASVAR